MSDNIEAGPLAKMKQIEASEGSKVLQKIRIHAISYHIFNGNHEELRRALETYHNPDFAIQLWALTSRRKLDLFQKELVRMLHNYLASAKTLVEHTRKFVRTQYFGTEFEKKYDSKVDEAFHNPFCSFIMDLRDFILHNGLPQTSASFHFEREKPLEFTIKLDVGSLRNWDGWDPQAAQYLGTLGAEVVMDDLVQRYTSLVAGFYKWFAEELQSFHSLHLKELNELKKEFKEQYGEFSN